jgi:molybdate transport system permease protein
MSAEDWRIVGFTAWVATLSVICILPIGVPLAWLLARREWRGKSVVEALVTLPLVLPPVATGWLLLNVLGQNSAFGRFFTDTLHLRLVFTWRAVLIALAVMSFPLLVRSARSAFGDVNVRFEQIARTLGASEWRVFFTITVPLARRGILGGVLLAFARALGEFGATVMVAGNMPGKTTTVSLAIFQNWELGRDATAYRLIGVSTALAFAAVWTSEWLLRRKTESR